MREDVFTGTNQTTYSLKWNMEGENMRESGLKVREII